MNIQLLMQMMQSPALAGAFTGGGSPGTFIGPGFGAQAGSLFGSTTPSVAAGGAAPSPSGGGGGDATSGLFGKVAGKVMDAQDEERARLQSLLASAPDIQTTRQTFVPHKVPQVQFRGLFRGIGK